MEGPKVVLGATVLKAIIALLWCWWTPTDASQDTMIGRRIVGTLWPRAMTKWAIWYYAFPLSLFRKEGQSLWCCEMETGNRICRDDSWPANMWRKENGWLAISLRWFESIPDSGFSRWLIPNGQISKGKKENGKVSKPIEKKNCPKVKAQNNPSRAMPQHVRLGGGVHGLHKPIFSRIPHWETLLVPLRAKSKGHWRIILGTLNFPQYSMWDK